MKITQANLVSATLCLALAACGSSERPTVDTPRTAALRSLGAPLAADYTETLQKVYVAYFGRPADPAGLAYYAELYRGAGAPLAIGAILGAYSGNPALKGLVDSFGTSTESNALYGGDNAQFVNAIYLNLFNRKAEQAGVDYWTGLLNAGAITRAIAALSILDGAKSSDLVAIQNKVKIAGNFSTALDSEQKLKAYSGLQANAVVRAMLAKADATTDVAAFQANITVAINGLLGSSQTAAGMIAGEGSTGLAIKADGSVITWGGEILDFETVTGNYEGVRLNSVNSGGTATVTGLGEVASVATNGSMTVVLRRDGTLYAWGYGGNGLFAKEPQGWNVGRGVIAGVADVEAISVAGHILALKRDGTVWAWGRNGAGQASGDGSTGLTKSTPTLIPSLSGVVQVAAGGSFSLALKSDGAIYGWGTNYKGEAGANNQSTYVPAPRRIANLAAASAISAKNEFALALLTDGTVATWGADSFFYTGVNFTPVLIPGLDHVKSIAACEEFSLALKTDGTVVSWGIRQGVLYGGAQGSFTGLTVVPGLKDVVQISCGANFGIALTADGTIMTWGKNVYGQLGSGIKDNNYRVTPAPIAPARKSQRLSDIGFSAPTVTAGGQVLVSATTSNPATPVNFSSETPEKCSVSGNVVRGVAAGDCYIEAVQPASAEFVDSSILYKKITVAGYGGSTDTPTGMFYRRVDGGAATVLVLNGSASSFCSWEDCPGGATCGVKLTGTASGNQVTFAIPNGNGTSTNDTFQIFNTATGLTLAYQNERIGEYVQKATFKEATQGAGPYCTAP